MENGKARIVELNRIHPLDDRLAEHFKYYYQPQFYLNTKKLKGFECLLRLHHPTEGVFSPESFLDSLNKGSLWDRLWPTMLLKISKEQLKHGHKLKLAINVSPRELESGLDGVFLKTFCQMVKSGQLNADNIEIEITEDYRISDFDKVNNSIATLRSLGSIVAIDDFGSGFCNLSAIDRLDIQGVKIDKGLILGIESSEIKQTIVRSLVDIANIKGCYVLAEGIETEFQRKLVTGLGCDYGQGFLLGHPSPSFIHAI